MADQCSERNAANGNQLKIKTAAWKLLFYFQLIKQTNNGYLLYIYF